MPVDPTSSGRFLAALAAALPSAALAQEAAMPVVKPGDTWSFAAYYAVRSTEPNRTWTIRAVTPERIEATENGEPLVLTPALNVVESPREIVSNPNALRFPLTPGKRWSYETNWFFKPKRAQGTLKVDVAVTAYEKVTVPAGEFDAFRLVSTERVGGTSPINSSYDATITMTYWYAPAARAIVKSTRHNPYLGPSGYELVSMNLQ